MYFQDGQQGLEVVAMKEGKRVSNPIAIKQFTIQHPLHEERYLQHACLEGPTADVYQRFELEFPQNRGDGCICVPLPHYRKFDIAIKVLNCVKKVFLRYFKIIRLILCWFGP